MSEPGEPSRQTSEQVWQVCAVCGYPLERQNDVWFHFRLDQRGHVAVPVDATEIQFKQRCDFCDTESVTDVVLAEDFMMPTIFGERQRSRGHWAACDTCGPLVRRQRWSQLVTHVQRSGGSGGRRVPRGHLELLYGALQIHMIEVIPVEEWRARADFRI